MHVTSLRRGKTERRERHVLVTSGVSRELDGGPVVTKLPEHIGAREHESQGHTFPQLAPHQMPSEWREQHGDRKTEREEQHADLVEQAQADHYAERAPEPHILGADEA